MGKADKPDLDISFYTFVRVVCKVPIEQRDAHWRVQYYQTFQEGFSVDFVGRFEYLETDIRTLAKQISIAEFITPTTFSRPGETSRHHATNAQHQLKEYYTPELCELVRDGFKEDFLRFGYDGELRLS